MSTLHRGAAYDARRCRCYPPAKHGFSLVELSIVLVILGLLVGGILSGQSLIRAAELRSVSTQYAQYTTAVQSFRDKYFAYPGDMNNAQQFWGIAHATPTTCVTTAGTGTQTCNGDGDGKINYAAASSNESFRFWQHLANAGLIEGSYDGITHGIQPYSATIANSPSGKLSNSVWMIFDAGTTSAHPTYFDGSHGNTFQFGGVVVNGDNFYPLLKPEEAWNLDTKIDDGKPAIGKVAIRAASGGFASCTTAADSTGLTSSYNLSYGLPYCTMIFQNIF